jgi:hypothetical protein
MVNLGLRQTSPIDVRIIGVNWTNWLAQIGSTIASSAWVVPTPLVTGPTSNTTLKTFITLSAWVAGGYYTIFNTIATASGETRQVSFDVECK